MEFHKEKDSISAYGFPKGIAISEDGGQSWQETREDRPLGLVLANGDVLAPLWKPSEHVDRLEIRKAPVFLKPYSYGNLINSFFDINDLPESLRLFYFARQACGAAEWQVEQAQLNIPDALKIMQSGFIPHSAFWRMRLAPNGDVWGIHYQHGWNLSKDDVQFHTLFFRSKNHGRNWDYISCIPYEPDLEADPKGALRDGYAEPDICFLPDGSVYCLMRTTDGNGVGPTFWSKALDDGITWSKPAVFDDLGVWPTLLHLDCGVTLAVYGRPGLYLRASTDSGGMIWGGRREIIKPGAALSSGTCAYAELIALDDHTALLAYSDFDYPNPNGEPCKTILTRSVEMAL
ncbi:sialidase family protein [Paenibacillus sp. HJGM_3]|uniref:sialidase family protein n=1 Tax=Paenibacillus sp. HJGM_3 TaxID=3379816 RepID=UPI00385B1785